MAYSKKIIVLLVLFIVLFSNVCFADDNNSINVNPTSTIDGISIQYDNQFYNLYQNQYTVQLELITRIYTKMEDDPDNYRAVMDHIFTEFKGLGANGKYMFVHRSPSAGYLFEVKFGFTGDLQYHNTNYGYGTVPNMPTTLLDNCPSYEGTQYVVCSISNTSITFPGRGVHDLFPVAFTQCLASEWFDLFKQFGYFTNENTDDLEAIKRHTEETRDSVNNVNNSVNNVNNSINNDNVDVDTSTLPTDSTEDITTSGFDNIFETLYNTFTSGSAKDLVINIPFTNKSFTVNSSNVYGNADLGIVKILIQTFWYFVISYFIVQDISKKINMIKSGNIEDVQKDNIKEDML